MSSSNHNQSAEHADCKWVVVIEDDAGAKVQALISLQSTVLTPLLDPRSDLEKGLTKWREEEFAFLLSRIDDVAAGNPFLAGLLRGVQASSSDPREEEEAAKSRTLPELYRVDVCNKAAPSPL